MVHAIREVTVIAAGTGEPGAERDIAAQVLAVLDRGDVVTARYRLERQYGMIPLRGRLGLGRRRP
jgi:hypothetical protein